MRESRPRGDTAVIASANNVEALFTAIRADMEKLAELHRARIRANFADNKTQDAAIEAKTRSISGQFTNIRDIIRGSTQSKTEQGQLVENNMKMGFVARLRDMTAEFRDMQATYIQSLRRLNEKQKSFSAANEYNEDDEFGLEDFDPGLTGEQTSQIVANDLMLRQRNQELTNLIQMMNQLNELFADLGTLIIQQGTILDRIDTTIVEAREEIVAGNEMLVKAESDQKNKCFYIYVIVVVLLIIIFGVIIIVKKNKKE
jgi:syntaxin 16